MTIYNNSLSILTFKPQMEELLALFGTKNESNCYQPFHLRAIRHSIKLFTAGCAGILQPVTDMAYAPYPDLVKFGQGENNKANEAFSVWLKCLEADIPLSSIQSERICSLYEDTELTNLNWFNLSREQIAIIVHLFNQNGDYWFGHSGQITEDDAIFYWNNYLDILPLQADFDLRYIVPTSLASELNGHNKLLKGIESIRDFYIKTYCVDSPEINEINVMPQNDFGLIVEFDTQLAQLSENVIIALSGQHKCDVVYTYNTYDNRYGDVIVAQKGRLLKMNDD
ncbi:DUF1281 domain-containing protein [Zophobihabitans entericus]|uniref:DUF1281 domain-containing protein n=1 Tax=Zophobihabitans entericus TaxID=1635327 RepID=A0A6G9ID24_9GAMM|nr:DUF1281 domain-containing protein [Zophobihabitans entericus]QIQ22136.1 DUF1281 domain-containing protein [Zophobihabitans entericus]